MKYKWDCLSDNKPGTRNEMSDHALDVLLKNLCTKEEYEELKCEEEEYDMRKRMVYDRIEGRFNYAKKKVTDTIHG